MSGDSQAPAAAGNAVETPPSENWLEQIPEDLTFEQKGEDGQPRAVPLREHPKLKSYKGVGDLAKAYNELEKVVGKKAVGLVRPADDAPEEERKTFEAELRKTLGVPEKPDGYEIKVPEGRTIADQELYGWYRQTAHELGLSPSQAQQLFDQYDKLSRSHGEKMLQAAKAAEDNAVKSLVSHYGGEKQAAEATELAKRGYQALAVKAGLGSDEAKAFAEAYGNEPAFIRTFELVGKMTGDHGLIGGSGGGPGTGKNETRADFYAKQFPKT